MTRWQLRFLAGFLALTGSLGWVGEARAQRMPKGVVTDVQIVGNTSIPTAGIKSKLLTRQDRDLDPATLEADYRTLMDARWFSDVQISFQPDEKKTDGIVIIFTVKEMPVIRSVEFRGRMKIKQKELEDACGFKAGARADHVKAQLAVRQLKRVYEDKGYEQAEVKLLSGGKPGEYNVVFEIFEGPKCKVTKVGFTGNTLAGDALLQTKIKTKPAILGLLRGKYFRDQVEEDARELRKYYQGLGFFEVKVTPITRGGGNAGDIELEYVIWEGPQYKVREIVFEGNKLITEPALREGLVLHSGQAFSDAIYEADRKSLESKYGAIGCIDAQIEVEKKYVDPVANPGVVDLIYHVHEGEPYLLAHFVIKGNERTKDKVIRREAEMAGVVPGEPINMNRIKAYETRLQNLRYFGGQNQQAPNSKPISIQLVNRRPANLPYGELPTINLDEVVRTRMQGPEIPPDAERLDAPAPAPAPAPATAPSTAPRRVAQAPVAEPGEPVIVEPPVPPAVAPGTIIDPPLAPGDGPVGVTPFVGGAFDPPPGQPVPSPIAVPGPPPELGPVPAQPGGPFGPRRTPIGEGEPPGTYPSMPGANMTDVGPDRNDPFPNRSWADIVTQVEEAPTGRFMFGVGATSYGGISGNFILHESNFDLFAIPRSWRELVSGQAFRGGGQELRIEASPGTLINRFLVSFRNPYLFDLPGGYAIGFGASGYLFSRVYQGQYNEQRGGGRFSIGSQLGTSLYADLAMRVEDVKLTGFDYPAPADYLAAGGSTFLASLRPSLRYDNRNDPFATSKGQYLEAAFEQGWGTFTWPKFTLEGRQYFTLYNRPDGSGKHILTFRGYFGIAGRDLPVYERFYAGDFRSMRGFSYRGVGPFELNRNVGGILSTIGSIEYQFPWIASDKLQQVVFSDFGTVESDYSFTTFRVAVGTGLRVYLPQQMFGPLPLAFDFAVPVVKGPDDRERLFTFFIGAFW